MAFLSAETSAENWAEISAEISAESWAEISACYNLFFLRLNVLVDTFLAAPFVVDVLGELTFGNVRYL